MRLIAIQGVNHLHNVGDQGEPRVVSTGAEVVRLAS